MFVILSYDVEAKRVAKVMKVCRRYLRHMHESVFEGKITEKKLEELKTLIGNIVDPEYDAVCIYRFPSVKYARKDEIGLKKGRGDII